MSIDLACTINVSFMATLVHTNSTYALACKILLLELQWNNSYSIQKGEFYVLKASITKYE